MHRRLMVIGLGCSLACSLTQSSTGEALPEPAVAAAPAFPAGPVTPPEPAPSAPPEPEPAPVDPSPPQAELQPDAGPDGGPDAPPRRPWAPEDERRIRAIQPIVAEAAAAHGVDPYLVNGVIWVESKFHRKAKNRSGARGLMQLMPTTAKALGRALKRPAKVYDPAFNVHAGTYYLSRMLARFDGDATLALAAYARGPGRVRGWIDDGEPLPEGVVRFVDKVQHARLVFESLGWPEPLEPEPEPLEPDSLDDPAPAPETLDPALADR